MQPAYRIRLAEPADAEALLALQCRLDVQTEYMLLEPAEREQEPTALHRRLESQGAAGSFDLLAADGSAVIGWVSVEVPDYRRAAHVGYLVIGVDADRAGQGIGRALIDHAVREARQRGLRRLELTVMTDNHHALRLYLGAGFQLEGVRRQSIMRANEWVDEYYLAILLSPLTGSDTRAGTPDPSTPAA